MNALAPLSYHKKPAQAHVRRAAISKNVNVLAKIYDEEINIAIWQRRASTKLTNAVSTLISANTLKSIELAVTPDNAYQQLINTIKPNSLHHAYTNELCEDIAHLVDMFCCLFDLNRAGLRLAVLDRPMCPRFHVDKIPCRLVTTYHGIATQWLNHSDVNRAKLGAGNLGKADRESGLFQSENSINTLSTCSIALLKGEHWDDKLGAGLVHRSPPVTNNQTRLLLTLDFL